MPNHINIEVSGVHGLAEQLLALADRAPCLLGQLNLLVISVSVSVSVSVIVMVMIMMGMLVVMIIR